jgi:hypothetical protein
LDLARLPDTVRAERTSADRPYAGRSLDERRAEQRERLLLAARDVFAARGFAAAGIDEIVARAKASRTTSYALSRPRAPRIAAERIEDLEAVVDPITEFVARGLIPAGTAATPRRRAPGA